MKLLILGVYLASVLVCAFTLRTQGPEFARWLPEGRERALRFGLAGLGALAIVLIALGWPMYAAPWSLAAAAACLLGALGLSVASWLGVPFFARDRASRVARRVGGVSFAAVLLIVAVAYLVNPGAWMG